MAISAADERQRPDWRISVVRLESLTKGALVSGVVADGAVTVVDVTWHGSEVLTLTYRSADGSVAERLVYREDEPRLAIVGVNPQVDAAQARPEV